MSLENDDPVYYRIYNIGTRINPDWTVLCMQWFDEFDYDKSKFYNSEQYLSKEDAEKIIALCLPKSCKICGR